MTHREAVLATLKREPSEFVPGWSFFSTAQAKRILLPELTALESTPDEHLIAHARATNCSLLDIAGTGLGGREIVEQTEHSFVQVLDNGCRRLFVEEPEWFYETLSRPLDDTNDLEKLQLPSMEYYEGRYPRVRASIDRFKEEGFFVRGFVDGFYAGIWEHCRRIDLFLMDLAEESEFALNLVNTWGQFMYDCAKKLLECGVDMVCWTDDLGSNTSTLISPDCYRKYFFPWHQKTSELAHSFGKYAFMHSHGNINKLLPHILETGVNVLDPVGPSDGMDLARLKKDYGDRLNFSGGISRFIADMSQEQLRTHLDEVYRIGSRGGGFLPNEEGGVPRDMTPENFDYYIKTRREMSYKYAT